MLRDDTNCAWLVGYLKKDMDQSHTITYTFPSAVPGIVDLAGLGFADCVFFRNIDGSETSPLKTAALYNDINSKLKMRVWYPSAYTLGWVNAKNIRLTIGLAGGDYSSTVDELNADWQGLTSTALDLEEHDLSSVSIGISTSEAKKLAKEIYEHTFGWGYVNSFFNNLVSATKYSVTQGNNLYIADEDLSKYNNKLVSYNNKVYRLTIGQGTEKTYDTYYTGTDNMCNDYLSSLYYEFMSHRYLYRNQDNPTRNKVKVSLSYREYSITATEVPYGTITYTLPVSSQRNNCNDAMYDMFCMPISPMALGLNIKETNTAVVTPGADTSGSGTGEGIIYVDICSENQLAIAAELATALGAGTQAGEIYDLQLLPYCPLDLNPYLETHVYGPVYGKNVIDLTDLNTKDYTLITKQDIVDGNSVDVPVGVVFYPQKANFATSIDSVTVEAVSIHDEWLTIDKPVLKAQGTQDGLTQYAIGFTSEFPYEVEYDSVWDVGPNINNPDSSVKLSNGLTEADCNYISAYISGGLKKPIVYLTSTEFPTAPVGQEYSYTFTGNFSISVKAKWIMPDNALDKKIKNECDFYRLTSPNYNSFYEFKATKLCDGISGLRAVCTYKPFTPYIKINPNLNNSLYSIKDYNDNIGLMLAGDYSIPMMSDAMVNYELQNRNYQAIFNRSLESLDVNQRIAREQLDFQGLVGTITGGFTGSAAGLSTGMKTGNPYVAAGMAIAGGVAGNVLPAIGWAKDREWLQQQQYEARDFAVDNFNYQLGNIKALPQSMTKSTPLSYNNKVWPILEYFSCTETEKEVLKNKMKYDGMTIMAIGQLKDYITDSCRLKGKMIRLENLGDDSHIANAIYEEVDKGFYEGE